MKTKIYSVVNKKGGVGKSTTVSGVASICANYGQKVLIVDLDPQVNSTSVFYKDYIDKNITGLLNAPEEKVNYHFVKSFIKNTPYENIDIIVGDENLDEEGDKLLLQNAYVDDNNKIVLNKKAQLLLTKAFDLIQDEYGLILIDNTPYFNLISKNALSASNGVLIPVQSEGFSYDGLSRLLRKIYEVKTDLNNKLEIIGVFFANVNKNTNLYKDLLDKFQEDVGEKLLKTYIRADNKAKESITEFEPLYQYAPKSNVTRDYMMLVHELHLLDNANQQKLEDDILYRNEK